MNTDIVPPTSAPATPPAPTPAPVDDVKPAPPAQQPAAPQQTPSAVKEALAKAKEAPKPAAPKVKKEGSGATAAIVATVIIVLGLAALATYAYLQTK